MAFPLFRIPDDILGVVFGYLRIGDLTRCARVSKRFSRIANANAVWNRKIEEYRFVRTPNMIEEDNWEDLKKHLRFARWMNLSRWCSPEAISLAGYELRDVHAQLARAAPDLNVHSLLFRGKSYSLSRTESSIWVHDPTVSIKVITEEFKFVFLQSTDATKPSPSKTIVRRRDLLLTGGKSTNAFRRRPGRDESRAPCAAIVDGVVLRVSPPPLSVVPAPKAQSVVGHSKLVFRYVYTKFYGLCPLCVRNRSCDCNGDIPPFCRSCWLSHDLNLYMSAEQARIEYGMEAADLVEVPKRYKEVKRAPRRRALPLHSGPLVNWQGGDAEAGKEAGLVFYREFEVAYMALLKWGSAAAIAEYKARALQGDAAMLCDEPAKLVADEAMLDVEAMDSTIKEKLKRSKRTRSGVWEEYGRDDEFAPDEGGASAKAARGAMKRNPRKAAQGKYYGEQRDTLDTRVDESMLDAVLKWGLTMAA